MAKKSATTKRKRAKKSVRGQKPLSGMEDAHPRIKELDAAIIEQRQTVLERVDLTARETDQTNRVLELMKKHKLDHYDTKHLDGIDIIYVEVKPADETPKLKTKKRPKPKHEDNGAE